MTEADPVALLVVCAAPPAAKSNRTGRTPPRNRLGRPRRNDRGGNGLDGPGVATAGHRSSRQDRAPRPAQHARDQCRRATVDRIAIRPL